MFEKPPTIEDGAEKIPTPEEIREIFEQITEGREFEEIRMLEDEKGLYLWDIKLSEPNEQGDNVEYSYMRKGHYPEGNALVSAVHMTTFDSDGMPTGGTSIAKHVDGEWMKY